MNKKYTLPLLVLSLLVCGCASIKEPSSSSSSNNISNVESSIESMSSEEGISSITSTSSESSSSINSQSSSVIEETLITSISEVREKGLILKSKVNNVNVAESDIKCKIEGKILACLDEITTKAGYGNRYKLLVANEDGYIYVKIDDASYNKFKTRKDTSVQIIGTVSYYCGEPEITITETPTIIEKDINVNGLFKQKTLQEIYQITDDMTLNCKGCNGGELVTFTGKLLAKMDDVVLLFYDGTNIIQVHGQSKFANGLVINNYYDISGAVTMYNFRPGFEFYSAKINTTVTLFEIDTTNLKTMDSSAYSIKYEVDKNAKYPEYTNMFKELVLVKGYVNYYMKDGMYYTVIDTNQGGDIYAMYQNAISAKALFIKNETCVRLKTYTDVDNDPFAEYEIGEEQVTFVATPYLWNTQKYWQIYALEDTIYFIS